MSFFSGLFGYVSIYIYMYACMYMVHLNFIHIFIYVCHCETIYSASLLHNLFLEALDLVSATFATAIYNLVPAVTFILAISCRYVITSYIHYMIVFSSISI